MEKLLARMTVWAVENDTVVDDNGSPAIVVPLTSPDWGVSRWTVGRMVQRWISQGIVIERVRSTRTLLIIHIDHPQLTASIFSHAKRRAALSVRSVDSVIDWLLLPGEPSPEPTEGATSLTNFYDVADSGDGAGVTGANAWCPAVGGIIGEARRAIWPLARWIAVSRGGRRLPKLRVLYLINNLEKLQLGVSAMQKRLNKTSLGFITIKGNERTYRRERLRFSVMGVFMTRNGETQHNASNHHVDKREVKKAAVNPQAALADIASVLREAERVGTRTLDGVRYYRHPFVVAWAQTWGIKPWLLREPWRAILSALPADKDQVARWQRAMDHLRAAHGLRDPWRVGLMLEVYAGRCPICAAMKRRAQNNAREAKNGHK